MIKCRPWIFVFGICGWFIATTLSIFHDWKIGFWSSTMPSNVYVVMCIAYVLCVVCLFIGAYANFVYKPKGEKWKKQ